MAEVLRDFPELEIEIDGRKVNPRTDNSVVTTL